MNRSASFRRVRRMAFAVLVLVYCAGCVSIDQTLTLKADGSADVELRYELSNALRDKFTRVFDLADDLAAASGKDPMSPAERRAAFPYIADEKELKKMFTAYKELGVRVSTLEVNRIGNRDKVTLEYTVPDLRVLAKTAFFAQQSFSVNRTRDGDYEFKLSLGSRSVDALPDLSDPNVQDILRPMLEGFRVVSTIKTPGKIIYTSSPRATARMAVWSYDFSQDLNALANLQRRVQRLTIAGRGLNMRGLSYEAP